MFSQWATLVNSVGRNDDTPQGELPKAKILKKTAKEEVKKKVALLEYYNLRGCSIPREYDFLLIH